MKHRTLRLLAVISLVLGTVGLGATGCGDDGVAASFDDAGVAQPDATDRDAGAVVDAAPAPEEMCAAGSRVHFGACIPFTDCSPGRYVVAEGTTTTDRACRSCPAGTTSFGVNNASCVVAPVQ